MEETFHFSLLRVSIIQILKAQGFDKCKPSTLNVITDLYIRMLTELVKSTEKFSDLKNDQIDTIDVLQSMTELGLIKPNDEHGYNTKSVDSFKNWLHSLSFQTSHQINQVSQPLKKVIVENRNFKNDVQDESDKKKKKEFYNNFGQGELQSQEQEEDLDIQINWVEYLIEKDNRFSNKFENTILKPHNNGGDYLVDNSTEMVNGYLPINVRYQVEETLE